MFFLCLWVTDLECAPYIFQIFQGNPQQQTNQPTNPLNQFQHLIQTKNPRVFFWGEGGHWNFTTCFASGRVSTELGSPVLVKVRKGLCGWKGSCQAMYTLKKNRGGPPESSILIGFSLITPSIFGVPLLLETPIYTLEKRDILNPKMGGGWFRWCSFSAILGWIFRFQPSKKFSGGVSTGCLSTQRSFSHVWFATVGWPRNEGIWRVS